MKLGKYAKLGAVVALSSLVLTACGSKDNDKTAGNVVNWDESGELPGMDLSKATDQISFTMLGNTMEGLYRIGKDSKVEPGLAKKTEVSKDGKVYTFTLRKGTKWSNGDKVTAQDFVYSWRRTVDPKTASQYAYFFNGIKNADKIIEGKLPVDQLGIKADGEDKLVVTLERPIPYFKLLMGFPVFFPQSKAAVDKFGDKYGTASKYMVYNGPFKLEGWTGTNLSWKLQKNDKYWDKKAVKLDAVNYKVNKSSTTAYNQYKSGELDASPLSNEQAKQLKNQKDFVEREGAAVAYLQFNQDSKDATMKAAMSNKKIRQAISMSINRKSLSKVIGSGARVPKGMVPDKLANLNGKDFVEMDPVVNGIKHDDKEAKKLWSEGLKEIGQKELTFSILGDDTDGSKKITETLQSQIESTLPGAHVTVQNVPFKTRLQRCDTGNFDTVISIWGADYADPISCLEIMESTNGQNAGHWANSEFDKYINLSRTVDANNPTKRWDDLVKAQKVLLDDQGVAPIYQQASAWVVNPKVKDLVYNAAGLNYNWKNAYIEK
ncbi:peptide ABC transporter substrate-binding protein [Ligilactobacillus ceti]|uniref:Oligopeptide ABC superfamily ATP binding cassette transporter, binding protein n=1 Tax=Ligilactobacillus ceti DSM 22408 TaxID=1122146 RepID=A0A0R2KG36_9LACO|nr:peptide ABC transporter substrate-binding protein [Ligilactobacillus ceti]KRN88360.1 oligopeptide ABC superfamily ATP binding cassette transporter, binding protein [Ligilactobacillus ceti DSM 22408]